MVTQQTDIVQLNQVILNGGLPSINFFNGRLLSSEDLNMEKDANNEARRRLGQAIGEGVLEGLEVSFDSTSSTDPTKGIVHVRSGAAINRSGQYLALPNNTDVSLVVTRNQQPMSAGLFGTCEPPQSTPIVTGAGVYILVLSPASGYLGQAQVSGLGPNIAGGTACGSRYKIGGVQFRLVQLDVSTLTSSDTNVQALIDEIQKLLNQGATPSDPASLSLLRNLLAHLCFGTEERNNFVIDPFRRAGDGSFPYRDVGALATLQTQGKLTDCDVSLALLYWTTNGIQFVDMGSVRRRPVLGPPSQYWPLAIGGGYPIMGEAVSIQFQEQITAMTSGNVPQDQLAVLGAVDAFRYLPSIGLLPVTGAKSARGFVPLKFFQNIPYRDPDEDTIFIEGAKVEHLVRTALSYSPIKLDGTPNNQEMIWLYSVRENRETITNSLLPPQEYMIFTSGHVPYQGNAQYDLARLTYSNYARQ